MMMMKSPHNDRTTEFLSIVHLEENQISNPLDITSEQDPKESQRDRRRRKNTGNDNNNNTEKSIFSDFYSDCKSLNEELIVVHKNLLLLSKIIKKNRSGFDDNNQNVQQRILNLKKQLTQIDMEVTNLEEFLNENSPRNNHEQRHMWEILSCLKTVLMFGNKQFITLLKNRNKSIKKQQRKQKNFVSNERRFDSLGDLIIPATDDTSILIKEKPEKIYHSKSSDVLINLSNSQELLMEERKDTRTEEVQGIAKDIEQISQMMNKLASMVVQHKELTQRIDDNVTDAHAYVGQATRELSKLNNKVSSNRGLILKIFAILVIFIMFVGIFIIK